MSTDKKHEQYLAFTLEQFDVFAAATIKAWPEDKKPLTPADFSAARYELLKMINDRHANSSDSAAPGIAPSSSADPDAGQYLPVTPAPWP